MPQGLLLFLLGTAAGSFLNVLAMRYEDGGRIFRPDILTGRSRCPHCDKVLRWYELIPIFSFILQMGKCRDCGKSVSWQYPVVETLGGLLFLIAPVYLPVAPVWMFILFTLLLITLIDLRLSVIPNQLNWFLALLAIGLAASSGFSIADIASRLIGAAVGFGVFSIIIAATKGNGMGMGDRKMAAALGLLFGWPGVIILLMLAFILGGFVGAVLLLLGSKKMKDAVPFGPFLALAAVATLIFGDAIIRLYL